MTLDLIKFLRANPDTEYTQNDVITAYHGDDITDAYTNANKGIEDVLERYHKGHTGQECLAELHDNSYEQAFNWIKEEIV